VADPARWRWDGVARACSRVDFPIEALVAEAGDTADNPIAVAIETDRGLRVAAGGKPAACDV